MNTKNSGKLVFIIEDVSQLIKVTDKLLLYFKKNYCILLEGEMGAGKTTLTKYLLNELGVKENVTSPTFVIMNQYFTKGIKINHIDAYRLSKAEEVDMYLEEMFEGFNVIEWGQNLNLNFRKYFKVICIKIKIISQNVREIEIEIGD